MGRRRAATHAGLARHQPRIARERFDLELLQIELLGVRDEPDVQRVLERERAKELKNALIDRNVVK